MNFVYRNFLTAVLCFALSGPAAFSQVTSVKLPGTDSTGNFRVTSSTNSNLLRLNGDAGFYLGGTYGTGVVPASGTGTRLMWCPSKASLRAGFASGTQWNDANMGNYSAATGYSTTASGTYAVAAGYYSSASGIASAALGYQNSASGNYSTVSGHASTASGQSSIAVGDSCAAGQNYSVAMGYAAKATGVSSVALGDHTTASGPYCVATGYYTTASGFASTAMGDPTEARGQVATAIGHEVTATGDYSVALGSFASTEGHKGAFIFGDASSENPVKSGADHEMTMRFAGGYRLFTDPTGDVGAYLHPGQTQWDQKSDSTKKEHFIKADGEYFLKSIGQIRLGSWNYKGQDPKIFRHYGPMAQDIFHYFGKDEYGTIGCDTTIGTGDMDGIMMICLQALEKRTGELQKANERIDFLEKRIEKLEQITGSSAEKENLTVIIKNK
jgi:hypothetical protein